MHLGTVLIGVSLATALIFIALLLMYKFTGALKWRRYARVVMAVSFTSLTISFILMFYGFLASDFTVHAVWEYSSRDLEWWLKISGAWAGRSGSLMLWTWLVALSLFIEEQRAKFNKRKEKSVASSGKRRLGVHDWTLLIAMIPAAVFELVILVDSPFVDLHPVQGLSDPLSVFPDGFGLNPLLRTLWMAIHPPLLFVGYALITIPFAASIAHSLTKDRAWSDISLKWSRAAWIFLSLGLGVGAIWAYVVLGWGGYWGWDPVEVSSLVPWVTLTAFLHAQLKNRKHQEYQRWTPSLGLVTFVLVIFATYVTRGGAWQSVHAWEGQDVTIYSYLGLMIGGLVLGGYAIFRDSLRGGDDEESSRRTKDFPMYATVILLAIIALFLWIGVLVNQGAISPSYYETRLMPLTLLLVLALGICLTVKFIKKMEWYYMVGWMLLAGVIGALVLPRVLNPTLDKDFYPLGPLSISRMTIAGFVIPSLLFALGASFFRMIKRLKGGLRTVLNGIGPHVAHIGVALLLIGYVATNTYNNEKNLTITRDGSEFEGLMFKLVGSSLTTEGDKDVSNYAISISSGGQEVAVAHPQFIVYNTTNRKVAEVSITSQLTQDIYIVPIEEYRYMAGNVHALDIKVKTIPLPGLLWSGLALLVVGIGARLLARAERPLAPEEGTVERSAEELDDMNRHQLRLLCRKMGLDEQGSAKDLRRRLNKRFRKGGKRSRELDRD